MTRRNADQRLARACQEVSGESYARLLHVVRQMKLNETMPRGNHRDIDLEKIEAVLTTVGALDDKAGDVLREARRIRSEAERHARAADSDHPAAPRARAALHESVKTDIAINN